MNLALPALILLAVSLPGFIFVYTYKGSLRNYNEPLVSATAMSMGWVVGLILGFGSHTIWVLAAQHLTRYTVDLRTVLYLLGGNYDDHVAFAHALTTTTAHPYAIATYFGSLYFASAVTGILLHRGVRHFRLDHKVGMLRFNNTWHYIFWGDENNVAAVWITVSTRHSDHSCLYAGLLLEYVVLADGSLERLVLTNPVYRLSLPADPSSPSTDCQIPGDRFVLWCKDVNTLNVDFIFSKKTSDSTKSGPAGGKGQPAADSNDGPSALSTAVAP